MTPSPRPGRLPCRPAALLALAMAAAPGCASRQPGVPAEPFEDPKTAETSYWIVRPASAAVRHEDFTELWRACRRALIATSFQPDRVDYRAGVMTSFPQVSKQFFEFWRGDVGDAYGTAESSLATVRRTLRFEVRRLDDATYEAAPEVVVERFSVAERRITSVVQYREIFSAERAEGNRARDRGADVPEEYWYATGRDTSLEKHLADLVRNQVR